MREKQRKYGKRIIMKRWCAFLLACVITMMSIPLEAVWAGSSIAMEGKELEELIVDSSAEEGNSEDLDVEITHAVSQKGDQAVVYVSAAPSEIGLEQGVIKVTKVEMYENGKLKKGKKADGHWQFTAKENGVYSFVVFYNSREEREISEATPSEATSSESKTADVIIKKAVIAEYEIQNLFPAGNAEDIDLEFDSRLTDEGAQIIVRAVPSESGMEKGVTEITAVELTGVTKAEAGNGNNGSGYESTPSEATMSEPIKGKQSVDTDGFQYREMEADGDEYLFYVKDNGRYTFTVRYGGLQNPDAADGTDLTERQFDAAYELDIITGAVTFIGVDDVAVKAGEPFELLEGVAAVDARGEMREDVVVLHDDGFDVNRPGVYQVTYTLSDDVEDIAPMSVKSDRRAVRTVRVLPKERANIILESKNGIFTKEAGTLPGLSGTETLSVTYEPVPGEKGRHLIFTYPFPGIKVSSVPEAGNVFTDIQYSDGQIRFDIPDDFSEIIRFDIIITYSASSAGAYEIWRTSQADATIGGALALEARNNQGSALGRDELAEMIFSRPLSSDPGVEFSDTSSSLNNVVLYRDGTRKSGGLSQIRNNYITIRLLEARVSRIDYIKVYKLNQEDPGDVFLTEYGTRTTGEDESGPYTKFSFPDGGYKYSDRLEMYRTYSRVDPYLKSEEMLNKDMDIIVGYTDGGTAKTATFQYRPTVTVEKWRTADTQIKLGNYNPPSNDDIIIGTSMYSDGATLREREIFYPYLRVEVDKQGEADVTNYSEPFDAKITMTIELPYELDISTEKMTGPSQFRPGSEVIVTFTDGTVQQIPLQNGMSLGNEIKKPAGETVRKIQFRYSRHYDGSYSNGVEYYVLQDFFRGNVNFICGIHHEDGSPIQAGDELAPISYEISVEEVNGNWKKSLTADYKLTAKEPVKSFVSLSAGYLPDKETNILKYPTGSSEYENWVNGQKLYFELKGNVDNSEFDPEEWADPVITLTGANKIEDIKFFSGEMTVNSVMSGWTMEFSTVKKGTQNYTIPEIEQGQWQVIKILDEDDRFNGSGIVIKGTGTFTPPAHGEVFIRDLVMEMRKPGADYKEVYGEIGQYSGSVKPGVKVTVASKNRSKTHAATAPYYRPGVKVSYSNSGGYDTGDESQKPAYQGEIKTTAFADRLSYKILTQDSVIGGNRTKEEFFFDKVIGLKDEGKVYIKIANSDSFSYVNGSLTLSSGVVLEEKQVDGEIWFQIGGIKRKNTGWSMNLGVSAKFLVDPAAKVEKISDEKRPTITVYTDMRELMEANRMENNQITADLSKGTELELCPLEPDAGKSFLVNKFYAGASEVLQQTAAGAQIYLGVNGGYDQLSVPFQRHQRQNLSALLSYNTVNSAVNNVEILVNVPKKGAEVSYNDGSEVKTVYSGYDMYLTGEVRARAHVDIGTVSFQYRIDDSWVTTPSKWEDVSEIKIMIGQMPANDAISFDIPLAAADKDRDGEWESYLSVSHSSSAIPNKTIGNLNTFRYLDYTIGGTVWDDLNEDGTMDLSKETGREGVLAELYQNGNKLNQSVTTGPDGSYEFQTHHRDQLAVKVTLPSDKVVFTRENAADITNGSKVGREPGTDHYSMAVLPDSIAGDYEYVNAGVVTLPVIQMEHVQVKLNRTAKAKAAVISSAPDKLHVTYEQAKNPETARLIEQDGSVAVDSNGMITILGLKESQITEARVLAENSLGDRVEHTYQIAVSNNPKPQFTSIHDWVAIEGDTIPDLWYGIEAQDDEEEYPAWKARLFGVSGRKNRSIPEENKSVRISKDPGFTDDILLNEALNEKGTYYIRYTVEDDMGNIASANAVLTVHGKLQGKDVEKHYFATGNDTDVPEALFFYQDSDGTEIRVTTDIESDIKKWKLDEGVLPQARQTALHPLSGNVSEGVVPGSGRTAYAVVTGAVDTRVTIQNTRPDYVALEGEAVTVGWSAADDATYVKWNTDGSSRIEIADRQIKDSADQMIADGSAIDTSAPKTVVNYKYGEAQEAYDNVDALGNPMKNEITVEEIVRVIGRPVITAQELYASPRQLMDAGAIKERILSQASATYHNGENPAVEVPKANLSVTVEMDGNGAVLKASVQAWAERNDNEASEEVSVTIREIPVLITPDIHLRLNDAFTPDSGHSLTLVPSDPANNTYAYVSDDVNPGLVGKYTVHYQTHDRLTGDGQSASETVYVHGIPEIHAEDQEVYADQIAGKEDLIEAVKKSTYATVEFADRTPGTVKIPADELIYEIDDTYTPGAVGTFSVTITADDSSYVQAIGLAPRKVSKVITLTITRRIMDVIFTTNNDETYLKGYLDGKTDSVSRKVMYLDTVVLPAVTPVEGYYLAGYKTMNPMEAADDMVIGSLTIQKGDIIPVGTLIPEEQAASLKIMQDSQLQACFSAAPVINGQNIALYTGESYVREQLNIQMADPDNNAGPLTVDDGHVNPAVPGTYQIKASVSDADGNTTTEYFYVQVFGKTQFEPITALHTRVGSGITAAALTEGVKAFYEKPLDIPAVPWKEENKINNGQPAVRQETEVIGIDDVDAATIILAELRVLALGAIPGREESGSAEAFRTVYVHGNPVIEIYDNGLYAHQSTGASVLTEIVRTGKGGLVEQKPARAYVRYYQTDGRLKTVEIPLEKVDFKVEGYKPYTNGDYRVKAEVSDEDVIPAYLADDLAPVTTTAQAKIVVADKMYQVTFETGEHGRLENTTGAMTLVAHGKSAEAPSLLPDEGYTLDYWADESGARVNLSETIITGDRTFTAKFKLKEFTVRFLGKKNRVIKTEIVKWGHDATPPTDDRDVTSSRFDGWSADYRNIRSDMDIYARYWSSSGGPNGGGGYVPNGPGAETDSNPEGEIPVIPDLILPDPVIPDPDIPDRNMPKPDEVSSLPPADDATRLPEPDDADRVGQDDNSSLTYEVKEVWRDEENQNSDSRTGETQTNQAGIPVTAIAEKGKRCTIHLYLLAAAFLEGLYLIFKRRRDKKEIERLLKEQKNRHSEEK